MSKIKSFTQKDEPLTPAIFYILLSLSTKERHGYDIMKQVRVDSKNKINLGPGTLYSAIKRLLEAELIELLGEKEDDRRKIYKITVKGLTVLNLELDRFQQALSVAKKYKVRAKPVLSYAVYK